MIPYKVCFAMILLALSSLLLAGCPDSEDTWGAFEEPPPIETLMPPPTNTPETLKPVVILMDHYSGFVDHNANVLASLPIEIIKEVTSADWDRANEILASDPDLIVIHWSAFYDPERPQDFYKKIDELMERMKNARTEFLYYTSASIDPLTVKREIEARYPYLGGRLYILGNVADQSWDQRLLDKVREILASN